MTAVTWLHHQCADLIADFLLPAVAAILPQQWANDLLWKAAAVEWLFPASGDAIRPSEQACFDQRINLRRRWAWTTLMEAAQAWRLVFRLHPRMKVIGRWPQTPGFVAASMHYGVGISALWHLRRQGLRPRFVFRSVDRQDLPGRPIKLAWYRLRTRLIQRLCPDGPITTGGAGRRIVEALHAGRTTPVMLFDTPTPETSDWCLQVGNGELPLRSGGARLLDKAGAALVFFVATIDARTGNPVIEITPLTRHRPVAEQVMPLMEDTMRADPGQWLLWRGVEGLFRSAGSRVAASRSD